MPARVKYFVLAQSNYDPYTQAVQKRFPKSVSYDPFTAGGNPEANKFIRDSHQGLGTFTPYFDDKLSWMPRAYVYRDGYAVYVDANQTPNFDAHPELVAKDVNGNPLFIPWSNTGQPPWPQYAGDVSSAAFRSFMLDFFKSTVIRDSPDGTMQPRYEGIFVDDVNLELRVCDAAGNIVAPKDPYAGQPMTQAAWAQYYAEYLEMLRSSLPPSVRIIHNTLWSAPDDESTRRQIAACTWNYMERGFGDEGMQGGDSQWSLNNFLERIDLIHSCGAGCIFGEYYAKNVDYSTACYFIATEGNDLIGFADLAPVPPWPPVFAIDLGYATSLRSVYQGVWSRQYSKGMVYAVEPGGGTHEIGLAEVMIDPDGNEVSSVTLGAREGICLRYKTAVATAAHRWVCRVCAEPLTPENQYAPCPGVPT
jgi:hypothetical protein